MSWALMSQKDLSIELTADADVVVAGVDFDLIDDDDDAVADVDAAADAVAVDDVDADDDCDGDVKVCWRDRT